MSQETQRDEDITLANTKFEYAWRYFDFHARQRVTMFNFFLLGSGVIASAYGLLLREQLHWHAGGVALIGLLACVVSFMLDIRNHQLVDLGEKALRRVEKDYLLSQPLKDNERVPQYAIMHSESDEGEPSGWFKHKTLIRSLEGAAGIGFLAAAASSFHLALC